MPISFVRNLTSKERLLDPGSGRALSAEFRRGWGWGEVELGGE